MILTFKIKHNQNFDSELKKAKQIAIFAFKTKSRTSKDVKHIGLKSAISNQILKKYSKIKNIKKVNSVKLTIPNQSIQVNQETKIVKVSCLKLSLQYQFKNDFTKINQIEIGSKFVYVSCTFEDKPMQKVSDFIGIDLNTTGHCCVIGIPKTGKIIKLGKKAHHIHNKYKNIRKRLQALNKKKKLKIIKRRESNIIRDMNHKISRKIVNVAKENNCGIKFENLKGIRNNKKHAQSFQYSLNSWAYYQLQQFTEYKARISGIPVLYGNPHYTSQKCSKCRLIGIRNGKRFTCPHCGHVDHADANASFNIALAPVDQLHTDRDLCKGNTDIPQCGRQSSQKAKIA